MTQQEEKIKRMKILLAVIENVRKIEMEELYGKISFRLGITEKTFMDYLRSIRYEDEINIDFDNKIVEWVGVKREPEKIKKTNPTF